jgi:hypothetical protein
LNKLSVRRRILSVMDSNSNQLPDICPDLVVTDSNVRAAIPVMHIGLAGTCFMCNFFLPGVGETD